MDTFKKIWNLIPDNWEEVLTQAGEFEGQLDTVQQIVHAYEAIAKDWIARVFPMLVIDWEVTKNQFQQSKVYQELEKVKVDVSAWVAIPDGFDWEDKDQRKLLLEAKCELLKEAVSEVSMLQRNGAAIDLNLAVEQFRKMVETLLDMFESEDMTSDQQKAVIINEVRPGIYALVQTFTGLDLTQQPAKKGSPSFDSRLQTIIDFPREIEKVSLKEEASDLPEDIASVVRTMNQVQHAMPVISTQLQQAAPELQPLLQQFGTLENVIDHFKLHFPLISEAVQKFLSDEDWIDLNVEILMAELRSLISIIRNFLASSPATQQIQKVTTQLQQVLPVRWVGFDNTLTSEQKMSRWVKEAQMIFTLPENMESQTPEEQLNWFKEKLEAVVSWINHVAIMDITIDGLYQRAKSPIEQLLSTKGADLDSAEGVAEFLLDKLKMFLDWIDPSASESSEKGAVTKDNNPAVTGGVGSATATSKTQPSKGLLPSLLHGLQDAIKKGQLIWQFLKENDLGIRLEDQPDDFQPTTLKPTSFQVNSGAVDAIPEEKRDLETGDEPREVNSDSENSAEESGTTNNSDSSTRARNMISWEQVISNLLGDRESGVISYLTKDKQDVAMLLKEEKLSRQLEEDFLRIWKASGLPEKLHMQYDSLRNLLDGEEQEPYSAADLFLSFLNGFGQLFDLLLLFLKEIIHFLLSLMTKLIDMLFGVIKAFKVPDELKEWMPEPLEEAIFGNQDPNLICLILAMPTVLIQGLLSVPMQEIREWMSAA